MWTLWDFYVGDRMQGNRQRQCTVLMWKHSNGRTWTFRNTRNTSSAKVSLLMTCQRELLLHCQKDFQIWQCEALGRVCAAQRRAFMSHRSAFSFQLSARKALILTLPSVVTKNLAIYRQASPVGSHGECSRRLWASWWTVIRRHQIYTIQCNLDWV